MERIERHVYKLTEDDVREIRGLIISVINGGVSVLTADILIKIFKVLQYEENPD